MFRQRLKIVGEHTLAVIVCILVLALFVGVIIAFLFFVDFIASVINITIDQLANLFVWALYAMVVVVTVFVLWKIYQFINWLFIEPFQIARRRKKWAKQQKQS